MLVGGAAKSHPDRSDVDQLGRQKIHQDVVDGRQGSREAFVVAAAAIPVVGDRCVLAKGGGNPGAYAVVGGVVRETGGEVESAVAGEHGVEVAEKDG